MVRSLADRTFQFRRVALNRLSTLLRTRSDLFQIFNIGVEVGQISFVLVAIGLWTLLRRWLTPVQDLLRTFLVYTLGILSAMWCMERLMVVLA